MAEAIVHSRLRCVILGASGHARVLIDCLIDRIDVDIVLALDADPSKKGKDILGVPIGGDDELLKAMSDQFVTHFILGLGSTRDNLPRQKLYELGLAAGLTPLTVVHPAATVSRYAILGIGCQVLPGAIVNAGAKLECNVIINTGAIVEHDCSIGSHVHISSGARLAGSVIVEDLVFVGAGATIRQCIKIGKKAVVAAGAVVVKDVPTGAVVAGVPAKNMR